MVTPDGELEVGGDGNVQADLALRLASRRTRAGNLLKRLGQPRETRTGRRVGFGPTEGARRRARSRPWRVARQATLGHRRIRPALFRLRK